MDKTIYGDSNLGKRLDKIRKSESMCLLFRGQKIPLVSKITIGRDRSNSIVIDDKMASRFHAVIQKIKNDFYIKDLNSTNGTFINNNKTPHNKYLKLQTDDIIRIGRTEISIKL